jgi:hypothetical protein
VLFECIGLIKGILTAKIELEHTLLWQRRLGVVYKTRGHGIIKTTTTFIGYGSVLFHPCQFSGIAENSGAQLVPFILI